MADLNLYKNATSGGTDGSLLSEGTDANPVISEYLDLTAAEVGTATLLCFRAATGKTTIGSTVVNVKAAETTLAADAAAAATTISVTSATDLVVGNRITIGTGGTAETKQILGISGTTLTISALVNAHTTGETVVSLAKDNIRLALDNSGSPGTWSDWGGSVTITSAITATANVPIWAQFRAQTSDVASFTDKGAWISFDYEAGDA